jgi:hypothetical protein
VNPAAGEWHQAGRSLDFAAAARELFATILIIYEATAASYFHASPIASSLSYSSYPQISFHLKTRKA